MLHWHCFQTYRNCSLFCTFWLFRNFYSVDAQHANDGNHSLNRHFQHCAHRVYPIYSVLKVFEIAVSFAHVGCYQFSTTLIRTMLTMVNVVQFIISDIGQTVYTRSTTIAVPLVEEWFTCNWSLIDILFYYSACSINTTIVHFSLTSNITLSAIWYWLKPKIIP